MTGDDIFPYILPYIALNCLKLTFFFAVDMGPDDLGSIEPYIAIKLP